VSRGAKVPIVRYDPKTGSRILDLMRWDWSPTGPRTSRSGSRQSTRWPRPSTPSRCSEKHFSVAHRSELGAIAPIWAMHAARIDSKSPTVWGAAVSRQSRQTRCRSRRRAAIALRGFYNRQRHLWKDRHQVDVGGAIEHRLVAMTEAERAVEARALSEQLRQALIEARPAQTIKGEASEVENEAPRQRPLARRRDVPTRREVRRRLSRRNPERDLEL
jgi:hypothetical protein